jgi:hypothetical protein
MAEAKLNPWNNNWWDVYDFTPGKFGKGKRNFRLSAYEKDVVRVKEVFCDKLKEYSVEASSKEAIPMVEGKVKI